MLDRVVNILFLLVILAFSVRYYIQVQELPTFEERQIVGIVFWLLAFFVVLDLGLIVYRLSTSKYTRTKKPLSLLQRARQLIRSGQKEIGLLLIFILYLVAVPLLGFFTSSFGFFVALSYALGSTRLKELILIPGVVLGTVYLFFITLLNMKFPRGFLF